MGKKEIVWVCGSSGFVGSALTNRLEAEGREVYHIPRNLLLPPNNPDYVYYLSSYGNYHDQTNKGQIYQANAENFNRLLFNLRHTPPKLAIYFSSSSVYGHHPYRMDESTTLEGKTDYAKAKMEGENWAKYYSKWMPVSIVRPFSITGVGEQPNHLIPKAIETAFTGQTLKLDPTPVHDFIDIYDLLNALQVIKSTQKQIKRLSVFNICSGSQYSNGEVVKMVEKLSGKKIKIEYVDKMREYDSQFWLGDSMKLLFLGWRPRLSLEDSIKDMVRVYSEGIGTSDH